MTGISRDSTHEDSASSGFEPETPGEGGQDETYDSLIGDNSIFGTNVRTNSSSNNPDETTPLIENLPNIRTRQNN